MRTFLNPVDFSDLIKATPRGNRLPTMMEVSVNPTLAPFLVSSTRSVLWVEQASRHGKVRVAIRPVANLEQEMLMAILDMGERNQWGNIHPLTTEGVVQCVEYLRQWGLDPIEGLVAPETDLKGIDVPQEVPLSMLPWLPKDAIVFLPVDRNYVGTLGLMGDYGMAIVHNAMYGVAIAWK